MLAHCSTHTLVSVSVASTKVALSLQHLSLGFVDSVGSVLVLCKGSTTSQDMGNTFRSFIT